MSVTVPDEPGEKRIEQFVLASLATLLLTVAGFFGLAWPRITLWTVFFAGGCYIIAFQRHFYNNRRYKTRFTISLLLLLTLSCTSVHIWLTRRRSATQTTKSLPTTVIQQSGAATTHDIGSPAVTGTVGSMNITISGEELKSKNKTKKDSDK
jgi:hypothetical protein